MHAQHISRSWFSRVAVCLLAGVFSVAAVAGERQDTRLTTATRVLNELMQMPEQNIPTWLLERAHAVAVIPAVIKVGLGVGGRRGKGVLVVRKDDGDWSNPIFVNLTGGSFGFQVGVQSTDVVLVFTSRQSIEGIVGGKVTLGADASVAAGPIGRQSSAATDVGLTAQVYSYSRASGLFAGVALDGAVLAIDDAANQSVYGEGTTPRMIFENRIATAPSSAVVAFRDELEEATAAARANRADDAPAPAVATTAASTTPAPAAPATPEAVPAPAAATTTPAPVENQGFQPVQDTPAKTEPLPATP